MLLKYRFTCAVLTFLSILLFYVSSQKALGADISIQSISTTDSSGNPKSAFRVGDSFMCQYAVKNSSSSNSVTYTYRFTFSPGGIFSDASGQDTILPGYTSIHYTSTPNGTIPSGASGNYMCFASIVINGTAIETKSKNFSVTPPCSGNPSVQIQQPSSQETYETTDSSVNLSGMATAATGCSLNRIYCTQGCSSSGTASGYSSMNWGPWWVSLSVGSNTFRIETEQVEGQKGDDTITINRIGQGTINFSYGQNADSGVTIYVDSVSQGVNPTSKTVTSGVHAILATKTDYRCTASNVNPNIPAGGSVSTTITCIRNNGTINFSYGANAGSGVTVYVDGVSIGTNPSSNDAAPGSHNITASKTGLDCSVSPSTLNVISDNSISTTISCPAPVGTINFNYGANASDGVTVYIDGISQGINPPSADTSPGSHDVTAAKTNYTCSASPATLTVSTGGTVSDAISCVQNNGTIAFAYGTNADSGVTVSINNIGNGLNPASLGVSPGTYNITAAKSGFTCAASPSSLTVASGEVKSVQISCSVSEYFLLADEGAGKIYKWYRGASAPYTVPNGIDSLSGPSAVYQIAGTFGEYLITDYYGGKVVLTGNDQWTYNAPANYKPHHAQLLQNNHVLICLEDQTQTRAADKVIEVDRATNEIVWEFDESAANSFAAQGCERLSDGTTLVISYSPSKVLLVAKDKSFQQISLSGTSYIGASYAISDLSKLYITETGNGQGKLYVYNYATKSLINTINITGFSPLSVAFHNGNLLVSGTDHVAEFSSSTHSLLWSESLSTNNIVWAYPAGDLAVLPPSFDKKKWTVMLYINGNNNLWDYYSGVVSGLPNSDANVNVIVEFGNYYAGVNNLGTVTRYAKGSTGDENILTRKGTNGLPIDMGDPNELNSFIAWSKSQYPADHYVLIIKDHGDEWNTAGADTSLARQAGRSATAVSYDYNTGNDISYSELHSVLNSNFTTDAPLDVLVFDTCLSATIEGDNAISNIVRYRIASEEVTDAGDVKYTDFINWLKDYSINEVSTVADRIYEYYFTSNVLSMANLTAMGNFYTAFNAFTTNLNSFMVTKKTEILNAMNATKRFYGGISDNGDLYDFTVQLNSGLQSTDTVLKGAISQLQTVMANGNSNYIIKSRGGSQIHGVSIYIPVTSKKCDIMNVLNCSLACQYNPSYTGKSIPSWETFLSSFSSASQGADASNGSFWFDKEAYNSGDAVGVSYVDFNVNSQSLTVHAKSTKDIVGIDFTLGNPVPTPGVPVDPHRFSGNFLLGSASVQAAGILGINANDYVIISYGTNKVILKIGTGGVSIFCGDVIGDGMVLSNDVLKVARASIGTATLTPDEMDRADVGKKPNGIYDGLILSNDLLLIARTSIGIYNTSSLTCKANP